MNKNAPVQRVVQIRDAMCTRCSDYFTERADIGRLPAGPVRDNDVGDAQDFIPAMPLRQPEKRIHAQYQAQ